MSDGIPVAALLPDAYLPGQLFAMVRADAGLMACLRAARSLELPDWYLAAGCIRNLVWDRLHGYSEPSGAQDIDLVYFDPASPPERDLDLEHQLNRAYPAGWEVVNQAHVHRWYRGPQGDPITQLKSTLDGLSRWPEQATCIGLRLDAKDVLKLAAPCGLEDLFALRWRRNPRFADSATVLRRAEEKRVAARWPRVLIGD